MPATVELHRWVPQLAVLGRAGAFVTHAGMGGCSEGLYQGVPMIAVPQAVDQFGNAALLEQLGVGRHVPLAEATPERLRAALLELTDSAEVKARSAALRDELRAAGGAAAAADLSRACWPATGRRGLRRTADPQQDDRLDDAETVTGGLAAYHGGRWLLVRLAADGPGRSKTSWLTRSGCPRCRRTRSPVRRSHRWTGSAR